MTDGLFRALCVDGKIHIGRPISGQSDILCVTDQNVQPQGVFLQIQEGHRPQRFAGIHAVDGTRIFEGDEVLVGKMRAVVDCCFRRVSSRAYAGNERFIRHPSSIGRKYHLALTREMKTCGVHNCRCSISVASYVRRGK